ncbi:CRISPR-associated protein [Fusobacterium animalis]|uniref:type III-A CRISPR-associated CARF protein Csm6 n=1 Tax=Fusobacterium animalis TaxID=76859 RepID=UPI0030D1069A
MSKKILLTFAGNTDPTRGEHDGPIIHICRYYKPDKIYLILTKEMEERDEEPYNIYERAIKENLKSYNPEIICIKTGIKDAHHFDAYFEVIYNVFEEIKKDNEGAEVYVNITSGTAQMISNLISYYIDATNINIIPIQVETYTGQSNASSEDNKTVDKYYKVKERAKENLDNNSATRTNRIIKPDLKKYSRVLIKNQIKKLLEQYEYIASLELLRRDIFDNNKELGALLEFAIERKNLNKKSNDKLKGLDNKKYKNLYYYEEYEKKQWYNMADYFSLANIKQKSGDISGYLLMLEPLISNIYIFILENIMKKKLSSLFRVNINNKNKNNGNMEYRIDRNKLEPNLKKQIEKDMNIRELKDGSFVYIPVLVSIIKYYLKNDTHKDITLNYFKNLSETFEKMKEIRNILAHTLTSISKKDFEYKENINKTIIEFFEKYFSQFGYKKEMVEIYDNINKEIIKLLK